MTELDTEDQTGAGLKGLSTVLEALTADDFPADKETLYYSIGDIEVRDRHGKTVPMREVLDRIRKERFETLGEAVTAIRHSLSHS